jgi:dTDP-4-dehydrorhamnose 3,5-epimerase
VQNKVAILFYELSELKMEIVKTAIPDVLTIMPKVFKDDRGFFLEIFNKQTLCSFGINHEFVQDNLSSSGMGVLRGLHYQIQYPQGKLVTVLRGEVFDVAVDLRRSSPYFGKHVSCRLSENERKFLWIPPGFAHGFLVLSEMAEFFYKVTNYYHPHSERTLLWNDENLGIDWPIEPAIQVVLSRKDQEGMPLNLAEVYP